MFCLGFRRVRRYWADVILDCAHGVERYGQLATPVNWIIRELHENHKVLYTKGRAVGAWRHHEYLHSWIDFLAMPFIYKMCIVMDELYFNHNDAENEFSWCNTQFLCPKIWKSDKRHQIYAKDRFFWDTLYYSIWYLIIWSLYGDRMVLNAIPLLKCSNLDPYWERVKRQ